MYLPLISLETFNEKLFNAYRNVLMHLDTNLTAKKFSYEKTQVVQFAQQICFYIQANQNLQKLSSLIPKLIHLAKTESFYPEEQTQYPRQPLQRFQSIRSQVPSLMNFSSDGVSNLQIPQQLTRHETNDSGVDLTEPSISNPVQNFLSQHHSKYSSFERHPLTSTTSSQKKHLFVGKTASSPIPEHASIDGPVRVPLKGVLSAPPSSNNPSDSRPRNSPNHQEKYPDEQAEEESSNGLQRLISEEASPTETSRPLRQFYSQRFRNVKPPPTEDISQYLGVETSSAPVMNTFTQAHSGMKGK